MQEEKFKKIVIGGTVAAVLLLAVLLIFLIYQLIAITVQRNREAELTAQLEACLEYIETAESDLEIYRGRLWLETIARELGMRGFGDSSEDGADDTSEDASAAVLRIDREKETILLFYENGEIVYEICSH